MASLAEVLKTFSPEDQAFIHEFLSAWGGASHQDACFVRNIQEERFLSEELFQELFQLILAHSELESFKDQYRAFCRANKLMGGSVLEGPVQVGRVFRKDDLVSKLLVLGKDDFSKTGDVVHYVDRCLGAEDADPLEYFKKLEWTGPMAWVTWMENHLKDERPMDFLPEGCHGLARKLLVFSSLGLDENTMNLEHLFFIYQGQRELCRPTVLDGGSNHRFRPAPDPEIRWGKTQPWEDALFHQVASHNHISSPPACPNQGQAEGVHGPKCGIEVLLIQSL